MPAPIPKRRRLRLKEDQAVQAAGWAWFIIGVLLALFFGGAVRALLSERQVRKWIEATLDREAPPYTIHIGGARILLADGIWPRLGLQLEKVEVRPHDQCRIPLQIRLEKAFFPIHVREALGGTLKFGRIRGEGLRVIHLGRQCDGPALSEKLAQAPVGPAAPSLNDQTPKWVRDAKNFFRERWDHEWKGSKKWFEGVELTDVRVDGLREPLSWIEIGELAAQVDADRDRLEMALSFRPGQAWDAALGGPPLELEIELGLSQAHIGLRVPLGEGQIELNSDIELKTLAMGGVAGLDFVPASQITGALRRWGIITDPLDPKRTWLTGQLVWSVEWASQAKVSLVGQNLKLSGDPGEVAMPELHIDGNGEDWEFKPFSVHLKRFSIRHLLSFLGRKGYKGVIENFGFLSGELNIASHREMNFSGEIEDLQIAFSRRNVRVGQRFEKIRGEMRLKDRRVAGSVKEFILQEGSAKGEIAFDLDRHLLDGTVKLQVDELEFRPLVQQVMLSGLMRPLAIQGRGQLEKGQLRTWTGEFSTAGVDSRSWQVENLKVRTEFAKGQVGLTVRALAAGLRETNPIFEKFKTSAGEQWAKTEKLDLKDLSGRLELVPEGGRWRDFTATGEPGTVSIASHGQWRDQMADGQITVKKSGVPTQRFDLTGPWVDLNFAETLER